MIRPIPSIVYPVLKELEGESLQAYRDTSGIWTIGMGHVIRATEHWTLVGGRATITEQQSRDLAATDLLVAAGAVCRVITAPLNVNQYAALILFQFNTGGLTEKSCTLRDMVNAGNYTGAAQQFARWNKGKDPKTGMLVVVPGLTNRRAKEAQLFQKAV